MGYIEDERSGVVGVNRIYPARRSLNYCAGGPILAAEAGHVWVHQLQRGAARVVGLVPDPATVVHIERSPLAHSPVAVIGERNSIHGVPSDILERYIFTIIVQEADP